MSTLNELVAEPARSRPGAPAILAPGRPALTYSALEQQVRHCAGILRSAGVPPTGRVAVVLPNGPEMAVAFLAVAGCAACVPLNPSYQPGEFRFFLEDAAVRFVIVARDHDTPVRAVAAELGLTLLELYVDPSDPAGRFDLRIATRSGAPRPAHRPSVPAAPTETTATTVGTGMALLLHTSGTTSRPKLVPLTQANLVASARNIAGHLRLSPTDRCLNVMPLFHIHALVGALLASLAGGASIVCTPGFDEGGFLDSIAEFQPTWYTAVPTIHQALLAGGDRYRRRLPEHRFRFARSSSSALPPATFQALERLLQAPVVEAYGMTEASHQMACNPLPPGVRKPGSVGIASGAQITVMDGTGQPVAEGEVGEIAIRGPGVTAGYENNPQANAAALTGGWLRTGDLGRFDAEGYLFIAGRSKDIVNRGGEKVMPQRVDDALMEHPDVAQAVAFAVPHPSLGEDLAAAVVLRQGAVADEPALREFLFSRLSGFMIPSQLVFVDVIPKGATGKVQRARLNDLLGARLAREFVAPRDPFEQGIESAMREVLQCGPLGVHDNFFSAGGDSLRGGQVMGRINTRFEVSLPIAALFRHPTVAEMAREVERAQQPAEDDLALIAEIDSLSDEEVARLLAEEEAAGQHVPAAEPATNP